MYDTKKMEDRQKVNMLSLLCTVIFPCLIKYRDTNSNTLQVPFKNALSKGKYGVNAGATAGPGIKWRFNIITTAITKTVTPATKRNMNLSVIFFFKHREPTRGYTTVRNLFYVQVRTAAVQFRTISYSFAHFRTAKWLKTGICKNLRFSVLFCVFFDLISCLLVY